MLDPSDRAATIAICLSVLRTFAIKPHWNKCTPIIRASQDIFGVQLLDYAETPGDILDVLDRTLRRLRCAPSSSKRQPPKASRASLDGSAATGQRRTPQWRKAEGYSR